MATRKPKSATATTTAAVTPLTQGQLAALCGVSARRIRQVIKESQNPPPQTPSGAIPCEGAAAWLKTRYFEQAGVNIANPAAETFDYEAERARLTAAQADRAELQRDELRRELVRATELVAHWADLLVAFRTRLTTLPAIVGAQFDSLESGAELTDILRGAVTSALEELASADALPAVADDDADIEHVNDMTADTQTQ